MSQSYAAKRQRIQSLPVYNCDVCKVDCVGAQSYQAHMTGQKHKKRLAVATVGGGGVPVSVSVIVGGSQALFCELCNVSCSGKEVMRTHINGSRHKQAVSSMKARGLSVPTRYEEQSTDGAVSSAAHSDDAELETKKPKLDKSTAAGCSSSSH